MDSEIQPVPELLQLPDPCLLAVLRCCADDPRSLFSAARAHSRLHQAAVLAASNISVVLTQQQQADSVLLYLTNHGQHVSSINLSLIPPADDDTYGRGPTISLRQLPPDLRRLETLHVRGLLLQLQPGDGFQGVLHTGMPLKHLQLDGCQLLDDEERLTAAVLLLSGLQHLGISKTDHWPIAIMGEPPSSVLQGLTQLTYLELAAYEVRDRDSLQPLHGLTCLQDLRLDIWGPVDVSASTFSGMQQLTHLRLRGSQDGCNCCFEPAVLAGKTKLQHLTLLHCEVQGGTTGVTELLSHLYQLQQLTHLELGWSLVNVAPAAAYAALTASSKLQHLNVTNCKLPEGVWQHVFPVGKQLPHLRVLNALFLEPTVGVSGSVGPITAPESSRLVGCCPGLCALWISAMQCCAGQLGPLTGLSGLQELCVAPANQSFEGFEAVGELTGLTRLHLTDPRGVDSRLLWQLTKLWHSCGS